MASLKQISQKQKEIVTLTKKYCIQQKPLWQQVPYLALQAQGRGGFSEDYGFTYSRGYHKIGSIYVDCATGNLMMDSMGKFVKALPHLIYNLADSLDIYNARCVIAELKKNILYKDSPIQNFGKSEAKTPAQWRKLQAKKYSVLPVYVRSKK